MAIKQWVDQGAKNN